MLHFLLTHTALPRTTQSNPKSSCQSQLHIDLRRSSHMIRKLMQQHKCQQNSWCMLRFPQSSIDLQHSCPCTLML
jgi:ABC-type hemin transport system ATPase subunit